MSGLEAVTFGETMALLTPESPKGLEYSQLLEQSFAGTESNFAIALARLGHRVGWFGRLGADPFGSMILKRLRGEGVDVSKAELARDAPTGFMLRETVAGKMSVYYYRKNSAMSLMKPEMLDEAYIAQAKVLHVTGITPAISDSCRQAIREAIAMARRNGVAVSFDPNLRLKLWTAEQAEKVLLSLAEEADYFLPGLDELKLLYGTDDFDVIVDRLRKLKAVSVLKGDGQTYLLEDGEVQAVPFFSVRQTIDTVGAGDGFAAGFIAGLLKGFSSLEAVRLGNLVGSQIVQTYGDWEGIPTWAEAEGILWGAGHIER